MSTPGRAAVLPPEAYLATDPVARAAVSTTLLPGEQLLWAGRPQRIASASYAILVAALWVLMALVYVGILKTQYPWRIPSQEALAFSVLAFACIGISLFVRSGLFYGVTDRRALRVATRVRSATIAVSLCSEIGTPNMIKRRRLGIIEFTRADPLGSRGDPGFLAFLGPRASAVYQIAISAQRQLLDNADQATIAAAAIQKNNAPGTRLSFTLAFAPKKSLIFLHLMGLFRTFNFSAIALKRRRRPKERRQNNPSTFQT